MNWSRTQAGTPDPLLVSDGILKIGREDDNRVYYLSYDDGINWHNQNTRVAVGLDHTADFVTFRLAKLPGENTFYVWRNDVLIADDLVGATRDTTTPPFGFGDTGLPLRGGNLVRLHPPGYHGRVCVDSGAQPACHAAAGRGFAGGRKR